MPRRRKSGGQEFKFLPFSPQQQRLLHWWRPGSPYAPCDMVIADGSIRSGKTIACICSFLQFAQSNYSGQNFIVAGKTIGALKKNVIGPMLQILRAWHWSYVYHRGGQDNSIEIGDNVYYLYEANNEASQDKLQGLTAAGAYLDEAALMPESFVVQAIGRCSVKGAKMWLNCNPAGPRHYINEGYIKQASEKNICLLHFGLDDNLTLSQQIKDKYRRMYTGVYYKRNILGLWVAADGLIYQQFADHPEDYVVDDDYNPSNIMYAVIGVDFGGTTSAHSFTLTGYTRGYKEVVTLDEYYHNNRKDGRLSPADVDKAFVDFVRRAKTRYRVMEAYCDSAEQTLIQGLTAAAMRARLGIDILNARKGPINDRIAFYMSLMAQGRYKILRHCTHTISALEEAVYDDKDQTKDIRLDDGRMNIDSLDSMEYSTESMQDQILYL